MLRALAAGLVIVGCRRDAPVAVDATPPGPAATTVAPPQKPAVRATLVARAGEGPEASVFLVAPEIGEVPVAQLVEPWACAATRRGGSFHVACSPNVHADLLAARVVGTNLVIDTPGKPLSIPLGGRHFEIDPRPVSPRDVPGRGCAVASAATPVAVKVHAAPVEGAHTELAVTLGKERLVLASVPGAARCRANGADNHRTIECDGKAVCSLEVKGAQLAFTCGEVSGATLLPCGAVATLPSGELSAH